MKIEGLIPAKAIYQSVSVLVLLTGVANPLALRADDVPQKLPFVQDWSNPALLAQEADWSAVPDFIGYRGDKLARRTATRVR